MFNFLKSRYVLVAQQKKEAEIYLSQLEMARSSATRSLTDTQFNSLREKVDEYARSITPSGHNGRMNVFIAALSSLFVANKVNPEAYWTEVWLRNGRKGLCGYHKNRTQVGE